MAAVGPKRAWKAASVVVTLAACAGGAGRGVHEAGGSGAVATPPSAAPDTPPRLSATPPADPERLRAYAATRSFRLGTPQQMTPTPDGRAVLFLRSGARDPKQSLFETDLTTGGTRERVAPDALMGGPETLSAAEKARRERLRVRTTGFTSFELSEDGATVLLSLSGRLFVHTRSTGETRALRTGGTGENAAVLDPHLSHDGKRVAYVRGNDVYATVVSGGPEVAITQGGTEAVTHGVAEFVA